MRALLDGARPLIVEQGITLIGITVGGVDSDGDATQLELPLDAARPALDAVLDDVRQRFGTEAVQRAKLLGREPFLLPEHLGDA